jgi:threonine synthase
LSGMYLTEAPARLRCIEPGCAADYRLDRPLYRCASCGGLLDVECDFGRVDADQLKSAFRSRRASNDSLDRSGVWRFRELLPPIADAAHIVTLAEGNTPLYEAPRSASHCGLERLWLKHQGMNPTGSFKDNGMTVAVSFARAFGARAVVCASTGNTSASMAAYAARANLQAYVLIPAGQVAWGKLSQALEYGAKVIEVEGNFDDALRIVSRLALEEDLYLLNSINPLRLEGQKAIAIELMEQRSWRAPDWIVLPGGNLGNASAFGKALKEMLELGFIDRMPRLAIIQAEGSAPFYNLLASGDRSELVPEKRPATLATAIKIGNPLSWKKALRALDWTDGLVECVSEEEIADAKAIIGLDGIGCEPASAAALAGAKRLVESGKISTRDEVVCVLTGNLLKDPDYTIGYHSGKLSFERQGRRRAITGKFANSPLRSRAHEAEIKRLLGLASTRPEN